MARSQTAPVRRKPRFSFGDVLAGFSVALITVPQVLAYAELAGMPAYTGLYAAALPLLAAAFFLSSPYIQAGPVATTALLTLGILSQLAVPQSPEYVALAALLAIVVGAMRVLIGVFRLGVIAYLLSQPVLRGFVSAAAILILSSQLPLAFGVSTSSGGVMQRAFWTVLHPELWQWQAILLAVSTLALVFGGRRLHPLFPGVLLAVVFGVGFSVFFDYQGATLGMIPSGLPQLSLNLPWASLPRLLLGGLVIALVGFAEATSIARTYAAQDRSSWNPNREFVSQGVANLASGLFGGFPVGASFSRSSVNRMAGAKTRWSGAITGLVVLAFLPFTAILAALPKAILGAIVIAAVLGLIRPGQLWGLYRYSRLQFFLAITTFILTLALAPRIDWAVLIGIGLAIALHLWREQKLMLESRYEDFVLHIRPLGVFWFGSAFHLEEAFIELLAQHPEARVLKIYLGGLGRIDLSAALALKRLTDDAKEAGLGVELLNVPPMAQRLIQRIWQDDFAADD